MQLFQLLYSILGALVMNLNKGPQTESREHKKYSYRILEELLNIRQVEGLMMASQWTLVGKCSFNTFLRGDSRILFKQFPWEVMVESSQLLTTSLSNGGL